MVRTMITNAFLKTLKKKNMRAVMAGQPEFTWIQINEMAIPERGYLLLKCIQADLTMYKNTKPVRPKAASIFVYGKCFSELMITL
jgi:hypothetical protein